MGPVGEDRFVVRLQQETHHLADEFVRPGRQAERAPLPVLFRDVDPPGRAEPVALVAHRIDDAVDLFQRHAVDGLMSGPGRHRAVVGVDPPVGQQVQLLVEQLPVQLIHGRPFLPRSRRTPSTVSAFCISHTFRSSVSDHLFPFALRTAFPPSLAGRYPCDYYGDSVALGLASLRRSHVRPCHT